MFVAKRKSGGLFVRKQWKNGGYETGGENSEGSGEGGTNYQMRPSDSTNLLASGSKLGSVWAAR